MRSNTGHGCVNPHTRLASRWGSHEVGRILAELGEELGEDWLPTLEDVRTLMDELPPDGGYQLFEAWRQIHDPPLSRGRQLPQNTASYAS